MRVHENIADYVLISYKCLFSSILSRYYKNPTISNGWQSLSVFQLDATVFRHQWPTHTLASSSMLIHSELKPSVCVVKIIEFTWLLQFLLQPLIMWYGYNASFDKLHDYGSIVLGKYALPSYQNRYICKHGTFHKIYIHATYGTI